MVTAWLQAPQSPERAIETAPPAFQVFNFSLFELFLSLLLLSLSLSLSLFFNN